MRVRPPFARRWTNLSIPQKFTVSFTVFIILFLIVTLGEYMMLVGVQHRMERAMARTLDINGIILRMNAGFQRALRLESEFFQSWSDLGFSEARSQYAVPCTLELARVVALSNNLRGIIDQEDAAPAFREHVVDVTFLLSAADHGSQTFHKILAVFSGIADEDNGLLARFEETSAHLLETLRLFGDDRLLSLFYEMRSFEKDFLRTSKRPHMQSALNVLAEMRSRVTIRAPSNPPVAERILADILEYQSQANHILNLDAETKILQNEFNVQAEAVMPIAETLSGLAVLEIERAREIIARTSRVTGIFLVLATLAAIGMTMGMALLLNNSITRKIVALTRASHSLRAGHLGSRAVIDSGDEIGQLAASFNDMAGRIEQRTRELTQKARDLEQANSKLREVDRMKSGFLSLVSHELRTPLTSVVGYSKLLTRDFKKSFLPLARENKDLSRKSGRIMENLAVIESESERLTRLINDVLDLARIESGRAQWRDQDLDPAELVTTAAKAVQGQISQKPSLALRRDIVSPLPILYADRDKIHQVLLNLLGNAIKFTSKGTVTIQARSRNNSLVITVRDTGIGIPPEKLPTIFDKFHQINEDTLSTPVKGSGLGLAICKEIIEHYKGTIQADSTPNKGTKVTVTLPAQ